MLFAKGASLSLSLIPFLSPSAHLSCVFALYPYLFLPLLISLLSCSFHCRFSVHFPSVSTSGLCTLKCCPPCTACRPSWVCGPSALHVDMRCQKGAECTFAPYRCCMNQSALHVDDLETFWRCMSTFWRCMCFSASCLNMQCRSAALLSLWELIRAVRV